jgi:hypothetical protein
VAKEKYKSMVTRSRIRRWLAAIPSTDFVAALTAVAAVITIGASIVGGNVRPEVMVYLSKSVWAAGIAGIILFVVIWFKTALEYKRRTFDPSAITQFQKAFDELEQQEIRAGAAKVCDDFLRSSQTMPHVEVDTWGQLPETGRHHVERILDYFTDLGFYLNGDQFSDEVVHHHLFFWIRGWYSVLKPYIEFYQRTEPVAYRNIDILYGRVAEIEKQSGGTKLLLETAQEKLEFLSNEL